MLAFRDSMRVSGLASLVVLVGLTGCPKTPVNTLTGTLAFPIVGSGGASGPVTISGPGGSGVGVDTKIILADGDLGGCVAGASLTCAPSGQRVEIDVTELGSLPLGMALSISDAVDVLRKNIIGGESCSSTLGTAISGSVTITASDSTHVAGSFSVTMQTPAGSTSSLSGTFDVNFCAALLPGGGTTGGTTTGGSSSGSSSGASSSGGQTSGGSSSGTGGSTGGTTTGGTTGGSANCAPGATWQGDFCTVASCTGQPDQGACFLAAGGQGQCFGGSCVPLVDFTSDPANCGYYKAACPVGGRCIDKICRPNASCDGAQCPSGTTCVTNPKYTPSAVCLPSACGATDGPACPGNGAVGSCCGGTCQDTVNDSANCGGCNVACAAGSFCDQGRCQPKPDCATAAVGTRCDIAGAIAEACCGGACIDVSSDTANCGACGLGCVQTTTCNNGICGFFPGGCANATCNPGWTCVNGDYCALADCASDTTGLACVISGTPAGSLGVCCQSSCLDVLSDSSNCGACGRACATGTACVQGACQPPLSFDCAHNPGAFAPNGPPGSATYCCGGAVADILSDSSNCGQCGVVCPVGTTCMQGACQLPGGGFVACGGNNPCPTGTNCASGTCAAATCSAAQQGEPCSLLGAGPPVLGSCCGGQCVDLANDSNNCEQCGQSCPTGSTCQSYSCLDANGGFVPCVPGGCAAGFNCSNNYCVPVDCSGQGDREPCSYGPGLIAQCCSGACVDLSQALNCGSCGGGCPSGLCTPQCLTQPTPDCTGTSCPADAICIFGQCVDGLCRGSGTLCAMASGAVGYCCGDGACADLANDPDSCGSCGVQCPAGQTCSGGVCSGGTAGCTARAGAYCKMATGAPGLCCGGGCIDVSGDPKNCGNCGHDCGGTTPCFGGVCGG